MGLTVYQLPRDPIVACSGGVDSMAVLSFLCQRPYKPGVAYFHHGTKHGEKSLRFMVEYCQSHGLQLFIGHIEKEKTKDTSQEEHWRNERYAFLHRLGRPVITAHHLDDCMEQWLFSCLNGRPSVIPYANRNVVRPFLLTPKSQFKAWCLKHDTPWIEDESNNDIKYMRNLVRHKLIPEALKVNPGLAKVVAKKVRESLPIVAKGS